LCGSRKLEVKTILPDDCLPSFVGSWWESSPQGPIERGHLIWSFLPHVQQQPFVLVATGRTEATRHDLADFRIEPLVANKPPSGARLPVAGLPHYEGEVSAVYRSKRRPALVISVGGSEIPKALRVGAARHQTTPTMLVAPYYGTGGGKTARWNPAFVDRIRRCEYPQYMWDQLPLGKKDPSILRLDQIQPIGRHGQAYDYTHFRLSEDALLMLDEWLDWIVKEVLEEDGLLWDLRRELLKPA